MTRPNFIDKTLYDILLEINSVIMKKYDMWGENGLYARIGGPFSEVRGDNRNVLEATLAAQLYYDSHDRPLFLSRGLYGTS